ncbi:hypothetical protein [Streptomyces mirabilis]|uniref:hypothetical protein n=1 Tax=Streptomyces mirabilis TaxID=68239 RepID=UPI0036CC4B08
MRLGRRVGYKTAITSRAATVNAGVGAGFSWAVNKIQCRPTTPGDLLFGALGGAFSSLFSGGSRTSLSAVEDSASEPITFPNHYDDPATLAKEIADAAAAGVAPIGAGTQAFGRAVADGGDYLWAVGADGELRIISDVSNDIKHSVLFNGEQVQGAGSVTFQGGKVESIDDQSGHYFPWLDDSESFLRSGVDAFRNAGVDVPEGAIKKTEW